MSQSIHTVHCESFQMSLLFWSFTKTDFYCLKCHVRQRENREEEQKALELQYIAEMAEKQNSGPSAEEIEALNHEFQKDARARMFWIYRTRDMKELKVFYITACSNFWENYSYMNSVFHCILKFTQVFITFFLKNQIVSLQMFQQVENHTLYHTLK